MAVDAVRGHARRREAFCRRVRWISSRSSMEFTFRSPGERSRSFAVGFGEESSPGIGSQQPCLDGPRPARHGYCHLEQRIVGPDPKARVGAGVREHRGAERAPGPGTGPEGVVTGS